VVVLDSLLFGQMSLFHLCPNPRFDFVFGDVRDEALLKSRVKDADVIIPLACIVGATGLRPRSHLGALGQP